MDIFETWGRFWTKVGILTLATSTKVCRLANLVLQLDYSTELGNVCEEQDTNESPAVDPCVCQSASVGKFAQVIWILEFHRDFLAD